MDIDEPRIGNDTTDQLEESNHPMATTEPNDLTGQQSDGNSSGTMCIATTEFFACTQ
jgi:hypothetical protein